MRCIPQEVRVAYKYSKKYVSSKAFESPIVFNLSRVFNENIAGAKKWINPIKFKEIRLEVIAKLLTLISEC